MHNRSVFVVVALLAPLVFSFALALDLYIPTVPEIAHVFHVDGESVQLTLSLFVLMQGLGQLFFGPLSDSVGRKPVALVSALLFTLGSLWCAWVDHIHWLIVARMVQAAGACGMMVVAFAMVRDLFEQELSARVFSYLNSTIAVSPLLAPIIGGYVGTWLGWRANFYLLALIGVGCVLLVASCVRETQDKQMRLAFDSAIFRRYWNIYSDRRFFPYIIGTACSISTFFCFFSISPYVIIQLLHVPVTHFGYYFAVLGVVFLMGSTIAGKLTPRIGARRLLTIGALAILFGGLMMWAWYGLAGLSLAQFLVPMFVSGMGAAFVAGTGAALALAPFPKAAGTAASLMGASNFVGASIAGSLMMHQQVLSSLPFALTLVALGCLSVLALFLAKR
jgi:Bcr/CflA subfamily drug resistance transporter